METQNTTPGASGSNLNVDYYGDKTNMNNMEFQIMDKYILSEEQANVRMSICKSCEHYIESTEICNKCKCYLPWKVKLSPVSCPEYKWTEIIISQTIN